MLNLVIADTSETFVQALSKQCKNLFRIFKCTDGVQVLEALHKVRPDILLLDLHLPQINGLDVLRTIRSGGNDVPVIVTGFLQNDFIYNELSNLRVSCFLPKPCSTGAVIACLQDLEMQIRSGVLICQTPQRAANHILLNLGFKMGLSRYQCVYSALMLKYEGEDGGITKCLYPKVAKLCGGNASQVEKAIRDAIKDAFSQGNAGVWQVYFPHGRSDETRCPSNEVFLARIAFALQEQFQITHKKIAQ